MIKFFRRIRQKLVMDLSSRQAGGKAFKPASPAGRYLLYAIGEIILVVIGILIALQINNWNELQKQEKLEQEYYCRLFEDVLLDKEQMSTLLAGAQERLEFSNQAVRVLLNDEAKKVEVGQLISLSLKAVYTNFQPNNSAYEDLKSGANLNIISDKSVIKALNRYFNRVEELKSIIMVNGKYAVDLAFKHTDNFATGDIQASIADGRFSIGLDEDLKKAFPIDKDELLEPEMRERLLREALGYVSVNTRQVELYSKLVDEIVDLESLLENKCQESSKFIPHSSE